MRPRVKICGLTRLEDALLAAELGADALGFVFAPSKRQVTPGEVATIAAALPPWVSRVGVFGPAEREEAGAIAKACRLDTLQLHGEPDLEVCERYRGRFTIVQAIGVGEDDLAGLQARVEAIAPHVDGLLLDTARPGQLGGTGQVFDWGIMDELRSPVPLMVAGGLRPENVGGLVARPGVWGVDVASGVEAAPGIKDAGKLRAFFEATAPSTS